MHGYQGKPREEYHPYDRVSGTGRGKRDQRKGGNRTGGAGENKNDAVEGEEAKKEEKEVKEGDEEKKEGEAVVEEAKVEEKKVEEEPEEEDEDALDGIDYSEYEAMKAQRSDVLKLNVARGHVENASDRIQANTEEKIRISKIDSTVKGREMHATRAGEGAQLLGFGSVADLEEDFQQDRRGGRGRGGRGGGDRPSGGRGAGGRGAQGRAPR